MASSGGTGARRPARSVAERTSEAADRSTSPSRLVELAGDPSPAVRKAVAGNPSAPVEALLGLAGDPGRPTRGRVVDNPAATDAVLRLLVHDADPSVRRGVPLRTDVHLARATQLLLAEHSDRVMLEGMLAT